MNIAFDRPPISEIVIAMYFNPPLTDFRSQHVGRFWEKIRDDFPVARQQVPVGGGPGIGPEEPFPMPRYWFIARDKINLLQIQKNAFMFNWRRQGTERYPRYHREIKPNFDRFYGQFEAFVCAEVDVSEVSIDLCELTYVNTIEQCDYWAGPGDTQNVIPSFSNLSPSMENTVTPDFNCFYSYLVESDLQLSIRVRNAVVPQKANLALLMFEIKASTRLNGAPKSQADSWFQRAHDAIVMCFTDMTSKTAQDQHWGRRVEGAE